ncbi:MULTISPECIES: hypothetical protein [unclassified Carboxylicivirga]|uniref:hypothetical protein n=1 Tax=Carboxylicivirga TaxID=1628153 RepID=UPI003D34813A
MIKKFLPIFLCLLVSIPAIADKKPRKKDFIQIENLIQIDNFTQANEHIQTLQRKYPDDPYLYLLEGICLLNIDGKIAQAITPLKSAKAHYGLYQRRNEKALQANILLAQAFHLNERFEDALSLLTQLRDTVPTKYKDLHQQLILHINYCNNAIELKKHPVDFRISNLGQAINTEYDEHSPIISGDEGTLLFTSNRRGFSTSSSYTLYPEDIYSSKWREGAWLPSVNAGATINSNNYDATCSLSPDGHTMIIYRNNGQGDLYIAEYDKEKWGSAQKLPKPINSNHEESHGSLSADGNTLLFTSNRPGGLGKKDIYMAQRLPNGTWGKVSLLSNTVNTPLNEESPFLSYDGKTLYFASEGHNSMGGYDIFKSEHDDKGQWQPAVNIGYPINTAGDDLFFIPTPDGQRVYFASDRKGGYGRTDIYIIEFPKTDERSLALVSGFLFTEEGQPAATAEITIHEAVSGTLVGTYKPREQNGKYTLILPTGIRYRMTIRTPGLSTITREIELPYRNNYISRDAAVYLEPMVLKK